MNNLKAMPSASSTSQANAKALRQRMTDAERKLWQKLRASQLGVKFRRQTPMGNYVVDFYCHACRLVVELDGSQHLEQVAYDEQRTIYLNNLGLTVLRFWNNEVLLNTDGVLERIKEHIV